MRCDLGKNGEDRVYNNPRDSSSRRYFVCFVTLPITASDNPSQYVNMLFQVIIPLLVAVSASLRVSELNAAPTVTPISAENYLQAQPLTKNPNVVVNRTNSYLSAYHSGAGENNVTLVARSEATKTFLDPNGGYQEFDLGVGYPWGFVMLGKTTGIEAASLVGIDAGSGDEGFVMRAGGVGLRWSGRGFEGWLVCDVEGVTRGMQLFWVNGTGGGGEDVPAGCEGVRLRPVYL